MKKKNILLTAMGAFLLGVAVLLSGCGADPVDEIKNVINNDLGSLESQSGDAYDAMVDISLEEFAPPNVESAEAILAALTEGMSYSVDSVVVNDDGTAVATVTLTCKNLEDAFSFLLKSICDMTDEELAAVEDEDTDNVVFSMLIDAIGEIGPKTNVFDLKFEELDDGWYYADDMNLLRIYFFMFGNIRY